MLSRTALSSFADVCSAIANECADETGFVSVRSLLRRFDAELIMRPLLVEGMLAKREITSGETAQRPWAVLVDSEMFPIDESRILNEVRGRPLDPRLRNTIAHELVHALAFRPGEFGVHLDFPIDKEGSRAALVREIEGSTDSLSPLLLLPDQTLASLLSTQKEPLAIDEIVQLGRELGLSRHVLVNRLRQLPVSDGEALRHRPGLADLVVGIGEWKDGAAQLLPWPMFANFRRNVYPDPIKSLIEKRQSQLATSNFFSDASFALVGGRSLTTEIEPSRDMRAIAPGKSIQIVCEIESTSRKIGQRFLYVFRRFESRALEIEPVSGE